MSRLPRKRTQGRVPIRVTPTQWGAQVKGQFWAGTAIKDMMHFFLHAKPLPTDVVDIWRNGKHIFHGSWDGLADDPTLW